MKISYKPTALRRLFAMTLALMMLLSATAMSASASTNLSATMIPPSLAAVHFPSITQVTTRPIRLEIFDGRTQVTTTQIPVALHTMFNNHGLTNISAIYDRGAGLVIFATNPRTGNSAWVTLVKPTANSVGSNAINIATLWNGNYRSHPSINRTIPQIFSNRTVTVSTAPSSVVNISQTHINQISTILGNSRR